MVSLGPSEKPVVKSRYLHLMPEDRAIWQKFILNGEFLPDEVWYDVRVGRGIELSSGQPEWMHKFAEYSYKKRIDVVGKIGQDYLIIECKPYAGIVALGQIIFYSLTFLAEFEPRGNVIPVIITDSADPDCVSILADLGCLVFEVGKVMDADFARIQKVTHNSINKKRS